MALYARLMVYTGLSLFIIRQANVYLVVCILTHITLHAATDMAEQKRTALLDDGMFTHRITSLQPIEYGIEELKY